MIELLEIERVARAIDRHGDRFLARVLTDRERADVGRDAARIAARLAAKRAFGRAVGARFVEIEILRAAGEAPTLWFRGRRAAHVSLTHEPPLAGAVVRLQ